MTILAKLACAQDRRDEVPNQELARELAESENRDALNEIAANLFSRDKRIRSDCIKVMYETGYLKPRLIADYYGEFIKLLESKHNRLVWGAMIALAVIAPARADEIYAQVETIYRAMEKGSVITLDNGVKVLAAVAAANPAYHQTIFPYLLEHLRTCPVKDVAPHAESAAVAAKVAGAEEFLEVLWERESFLTTAQLARVKRLRKGLVS